MTGPETFHLEGLVAEVDGSRVLRKSVTGVAAEARQKGLELARQVLRSGADAILARLYAASTGAGDAPAN